MDNAQQKTSLLYSTLDDDVFVIDIPRSIELAQGTPQHPWSKSLISIPLLSAPLPSTEPKTEKARQRVLGRGQVPTNHERVQAINRACTRLQFTGPFALPRAQQGQETSTQQKRKLEESSHESSAIFKLLLRYSTGSLLQNAPTYQFPQISTKWHHWTPIHTNAEARPSTLRIKSQTSEKTSVFHLPPHSTLVLHDLPFPTPALAPVPSTGFNLILLDPPWPNRSARRSSKYTTTSSFDNMRHLLSNLNLPMYLPDDGSGIVAIWITNSARAHDIVYGWLADMGMRVYEEWLWVKITSIGEPVTPLDGLWRKPFESLLLARQTDHDLQVKRRVLFGVPDLHSRKPCLKELFERLIQPVPRCILEVFARNLTSDWTSWGNEVLFFNEEAYWTENCSKA